MNLEAIDRLIEKIQLLNPHARPWSPCRKAHAFVEAGVSVNRQFRLRKQMVLVEEEDRTSHAIDPVFCK